MIKDLEKVEKRLAALVRLETAAMELQHNIVHSDMSFLINPSTLNEFNDALFESRKLHRQ